MYTANEIFVGPCRSSSGELLAAGLLILRSFCSVGCCEVIHLTVHSNIGPPWTYNSLQQVRPFCSHLFSNFENLRRHRWIWDHRAIFDLQLKLQKALFLIFSNLLVILYLIWFLGSLILILKHLLFSYLSVIFRLL